MEIIVFGLVSFVILSMWCGVMDILYDIRRDVMTLLARGDEDSSNSVNAQEIREEDSWNASNMHHLD